MDARKRGRPEPGFANGGHKKFKHEMDSSIGVGTKSKPCTKFFSTSGCPFGESCHFQHYVPGGYSVVAQMMNLGPVPAAQPRNIAPPPPVSNGSSQPNVKNRMCTKYNTAEGCKFGDKCFYAHGEWELGKLVVPSHDDPRAFGAMSGRMGFGRAEPPPSGPGPASFGASATAKVSVDASLAGTIIGKGGVNIKQISRQTGAKLSIQDHETDPNLRNIELEGSFDQIKQASAMVTELIQRVGAAKAPARAPASGVPGAGGGRPHPGSNFKTKLCDNFTKGTCTFGERCHFAHGATELRNSGV